MRKVALGVTGVVVGKTLALGVGGGTAAAEQYDCGPYSTGGTSYFDGYSHYEAPANTYEGASANVTVRYGAVCDTDTDAFNNFTNAFVMLQDSTGNNYSQAGFERAYNSSLYSFTQQTKQGGGYVTGYKATNISANQTHTYKTAYSANCGCEQAIIDKTVRQQTPYNPFGVWQQPFVPTYTGEARYKASDIPGTGGARTNFRGEQTQRFNDDQFQGNPCGMSGYSDTNRWGRAQVSCTAHDVWTATP